MFVGTLLFSSLSDLFGRRTFQMGEHAPVGLHFSMGGYLAEAHPDAVQGMVELLRGGRVENPMSRWPVVR